MSDKAVTLLNWLLARLGEQSTYKGLILLLTATGIYLKPEQVAAISSAGLAVVGLINCFRNEGKAAEKAVAQSDKVREIVAQVNVNTADIASQNK